jgi:hypothetical protein
MIIMEFPDDPIIKEMNNEKEVNGAIALSFVIGVIFGIILASLLHKFIVHPFGF